MVGGGAFGNQPEWLINKVAHDGSLCRIDEIPKVVFAVVVFDIRKKKTFATKYTKCLCAAPG